MKYFGKKELQILSDDFDLSELNIDEVMELLSNSDEDELVNCLRDLTHECHSWDGSLEEYYYYENTDEFFEMFFDGKPQEAVRAVCFGNYEYGNDLVQFNGYGNLTTCSNWEYEKELKDNQKYIIETVLDLIDNIDTDSLSEILLDIIEELLEEVN